MKTSRRRNGSIPLPQSVGIPIRTRSLGSFGPSPSSATISIGPSICPPFGLSRVRPHVVHRPLLYHRRHSTHLTWQAARAGVQRTPRRALAPPAGHDRTDYRRQFHQLADSNVSTTDGSRFEPSSSYGASGQQPDHSPHDACERLLATSPGSIPARRQGISGYCCTSPHPLYSTPMKSYFLWRASGICAPPFNNPHTLATTRLSLRNQFLYHPCLARRTPKVQKILPGGESNPAFARSV